MRALKNSKLSEKSCNYGLFKVNFWGSGLRPGGSSDPEGGVTPSVKGGYAKLSNIFRRISCVRSLHS